MADAGKDTSMTSLVHDVRLTLLGWPVFAFYAVATLVAAAIVGMITVDIIDLGMQHFGEESHRTHDVAYGGLFTALVLGVVVQLRRPMGNVAGMAMALIPPAALLLAALLVDDIDRVFEFNPLRYAAAIAAVSALLHPAGRAFFRSFRPTAISWPMAALTGVAAVPLLGFASSNLDLQRDVTDIHVFMGHYGFMAALAYTIMGVALLACLRPIGWRLPGAVASILTAGLGITSLLFPDAASSLNASWALAAIAWGLAFLALSARTSDAEQPTTDIPHQRESNVLA